MPTPLQDGLLLNTVGTVRFVYNLALEQRRNFWRQYRVATGDSFSFVSQGRELTQLRAEVEWIRAVSSSALTQALRDLDKAFSNFFAGRAGYPTYRRKGRNESFRVQWKDVTVRSLNAKWSEIRLPNIGWLKVRLTRLYLGQPQSVVVSRDPLGWFITIQSAEVPTRPETGEGRIAIDRGIKLSLVTSLGAAVCLPSRIAKLEQVSRRLRRKLERKRRLSQRWKKHLERLSKLLSKIARIRADWRHRETTELCSRFREIVIEDLNTKDMTRAASGPGRASKAGLNREILAQGWYAFEKALTYKLEERGGVLIKVNPAYSSQECSSCGIVDKRSRKNQADFCCVHCGFKLNADFNAALNLLRRSTASMGVEGPGYRPFEALTGRDPTIAKNLALAARGC